MTPSGLDVRHLLFSESHGKRDERNPTVIVGTLELTGHDVSGILDRLRNARRG